MLCVLGLCHSSCPRHIAAEAVGEVSRINPRVHPSADTVCHSEGDSSRGLGAADKEGILPGLDAEGLVEA